LQLLWYRLHLRRAAAEAVAAATKVPAKLR